MFHRFSGSARSVVLRARDNAISEGRKFIESDHILLALLDLHSELFEKLLGYRIDIQAVQGELAPLTKPTDVSCAPTKMRFNEQFKPLMSAATEEARTSWKQWEAPRRRVGTVLPEDISYWEARLGQAIGVTHPSRWLDRWLLRRTWEVDERHLLLGLLKVVEGPAVTVLRKRGVTLEAARQRLCATDE